MHRAIIVLVLTMALAGPGSAEGLMEAEDRGNALDSAPMLRIEPVLQVEIEARIIGIAYDGTDFWLSQQGDGGSDPPKFHRVSEAGVTLDSYVQVDAWEDGVHDIHFSNGLLWGSECFWIRGFNLDGTWDGSTKFAGPTIFNALDPCRLVCLNSTNDFWYAGAWNQQAYRAQWDGTPAAMPLWYPVTPDPLPGASGAAYDPVHDCIWLADGVTNTLHKLSPDGGPSLGQIPFIGAMFGSPRGLCVAEIEPLIVLTAVFVDDEDRAPGWLVAWDIEDINDAATPVESASWSSIKAMFR